MLELQHISYDVEQDGDNKGILRDINLTIDERFVAITGPTGAVSPPWLRSSPASISPPPAASCRTGGHHRPGHYPAGPAGHQLCLPAAGALQGPDGKGPHHPGQRQEYRRA